MPPIDVAYDEYGMLNGPYYGHYFDINPFDASIPHPYTLCEGNCPKHPLITKGLLPLTNDKMYVTWGDLCYMETLQDEAKLTPFQKQELAAKAIVEETARVLLRESRLRERYAEKMNDIAHMGLKRNEEVKKKPVPCKWLYADESVPKSLWRKNEKGERCAPLAGHLTGAQCWAWEYVDPKTKQYHLFLNLVSDYDLLILGTSQ